VIEGRLSAVDLNRVRRYIALNRAAILDHWGRTDRRRGSLEQRKATCMMRRYIATVEYDAGEYWISFPGIQKAGSHAKRVEDIIPHACNFLSGRTKCGAPRRRRLMTRSAHRSRRSRDHHRPNVACHSGPSTEPRCASQRQSWAVTARRLRCLPAECRAAATGAGKPIYPT
jgi:hypothetical protein